MRYTSQRTLRRRSHLARTTRATGAARPVRSLAARLRFAGRSASWWAPSTVALLLIAVALSGAGTAASARGARSLAPAHPWIGRASPPTTLPPIARWQDVKDGTAYALHVTNNPLTADLSAARGGNLLTFTAPNGDEIGALVPLAKLADGSYAQTTSKDPTVLGGCQSGTLVASSQTSTPNGPSGASITQTVAFALQAHFDPYLLAAYAHILYAPLSDQLATAAVCQGQATASGVTSLEMNAGCTAAGCGAPLDDAMTAPPAYEQAIVKAMKERGIDGWSAVWNLTSRAVTAQYSQADFAALMNRLSDQVGTITAISETSGPPAVEWDTGGQAYYTIVENVTYTHGGKSKTVSVTSYYLLEGGEWMFWFSAPYGS